MHQGTAGARTPIMLMPAISRFMTREPYSITSTASARLARELMTSHEIRHLPVLDGEKLVGIIRSDDLLAVESIPGMDLEHVEVARLMTPPICVWGSAPLDEVSTVMADMKTDCVVVLGGHGVQGIFTSIDAFHALDEVVRNATT